MHRAWLWAAFAGVLFFAQSAAAEDEIRVFVDRASGDPYKVAVQRFDADLASAGAVEDFYGELTNAISYNAGFASMDSSAFLEPQATQKFDKVAINCENWRAIGASILVQGLLQRPGSKQRAQYRVWDIDRCSLQGDVGIVEDSQDQLWSIARRLADDIVQRFTGMRGVSATQIAFVSDESGHKEVYVMEADGTRRRRLTKNGNVNMFPGWSPTAAELLYTTFRTGVPELRVLGRGSNGQEALVKIPPEYKKLPPPPKAVFGPQDGWVTVVMDKGGASDLFMMRRDGREVRRLTDGDAINISPSWSPDRKKLAFASDRSGKQQIYVMEVDSGLIRRLTYKGDYNAEPSWSPTGEWIAYSARTGSNMDIYVIDPESGYTVPLVLHERSDEGPSWSPDGRKVAFSSDRRGRREVYTIDIDGRNLRRLTPDFGNSSSPAWAHWVD